MKMLSNRDAEIQMTGKPQFGKDKGKENHPSKDEKKGGQVKKDKMKDTIKGKGKKEPGISTEMVPYSTGANDYDDGGSNSIPIYRYRRGVWVRGACFCPLELRSGSSLVIYYYSTLFAVPVLMVNLF